MTHAVDLLIVGAGPAGMSAAIRARACGLTVLVVDEQPEPGGQIWRGVERVGPTARGRKLGASYAEGLPIVARFRRSGALFEPTTTLWHLEDGPVAYLKSAGATRRIRPRAVLLATGALERPTPFKGWTLPGVMSVGAAQILLKSAGHAPDGSVWIAGSGPLAYLYAAQLLALGVRLTGFLDTTPRGRIAGNARALLKALLGQPGDLAKGLLWLGMLRIRCRYVPHVSHIAAHGSDRVEHITFRSAGRAPETAPAEHLLVHEGIVPAIHPTMALGCDHSWNEAQDSYAPIVDVWGETSVPRVFAAGDVAGVAGAKAACLRGELAALRCAWMLSALSASDADRAAQPVRKALARAMAARPFLDAAYRPRRAALSPADDALACRCEEVSAARIRALCRDGKGDPNRIKAFSRAGMGACQGRLCNYTIANILAEETGVSPAAIGLYRVRPPFKPVTLDELALLQTEEGQP